MAKDEKVTRIPREQGSELPELEVRSVMVLSDGTRLRTAPPVTVGAELLKQEPWMTASVEVRNDRGEWDVAVVRVGSVIAVLPPKL